MGEDYHGVVTSHTGEPECYAHMKGESPLTLYFGLASTAVKPKIRNLHENGALAILAKILRSARVRADDGRHGVVPRMLCDFP